MLAVTAAMVWLGDILVVRNHSDWLQCSPMTVSDLSLLFGVE